MASDFATEFAADAFPDLLTEFGEAVTHRPLGNSNNDAAADVVFCEHEPTEERGRGKSVRRRATLTVNASLTLDVTDQWVIDSEVWNVESVAGTAGGLRQVRLVRLEDEIRSGRLSQIL